MRHRAFRFLLPTLVVFLVSASAAWGQGPAGGLEGLHRSIANFSELENVEEHTWHVFGKVTTLNGEPAGKCSVRVQVANQSAGLQAL